MFINPQLLIRIPFPQSVATYRGWLRGGKPTRNTSELERKPGESRTSRLAAQPNAEPSDLGSRVFRFRTDVGSEEKRASHSSAKRFRRMFPKHHEISPGKSSKIKETELRSDGRDRRAMRRTFHQQPTSEMEPMGN